ncbi:MAG TPA: hypothetical protein VGT00_20480 [Methylomirabilota bacterium]|jgi:spermidine synthase|nr:hypothetical protein [Methylomirabilota bacterium]
MPTQLMLGHLPMLLHPDPRRVVVIGMGSGITAGSVARYPIERLDIVEIEPAGEPGRAEPPRCSLLGGGRLF